MNAREYIARLVKGPGIASRLEHESKLLMERFDQLLSTNHSLHEEISHLRNAVTALTDDIDRFDKRLADDRHMISSLTSQHTPSLAANQSNEKSLLVDNHALDEFYMGLEANFRGSEEEIKERQRTHLPHFTPLKSASQKKPVLDIGCGRGEFIDLMKEAGIKAIGLDLNADMVARARDKGFDVIEADAVTYLNDQKASSYSAITGFHIVEHIPFETLITMFDACYRALTKGGFVLFETPNPENLNVGSCSFYMDPSHLHPIPPALLEYALKSRGFKKTEVVRLHPITENDAIKKLPADLRNRIYGPQDYAVIAYR